MTPAERHIRRLARKYNVDPRAAIAVALGEGGLRNREGDVGDLAGGGSYGPFQLYAQGALPRRFRGNPTAADTWAWSPDGIDYALRQMVKAGAGGLEGPRAVETIIRRFERPADPDTSVQRALARYGSVPAGTAAVPARAPEGGDDVARALVEPVGPSRDDLKRQALLSLIAERRQGSSRAGTLAALNELAEYRPPAPAVSRAAGAGGPEAAPRPDVVELEGGGLYELPHGLPSPIRGDYQPLGRPGQGTHGYDEGPDNWQSDNAWDFGVPDGTPVYAIAPGVIAPNFGSLGRPGTRFGGNRLTVEGAKNAIFYQHLSRYGPGIKPGARVKRGQLLGYSGSGHLHLGIRDL